MARTELLPEVTKFIDAPKMLIDGKAVDAASANTFESFDPSTGEVFVEVPRGGAEDIDAAVNAARASFEDGLLEVTVKGGVDRHEPERIEIQ